MNLRWIFHAPVEKQQRVFDAVSPIVERAFPKSVAFIDTHNNRLMFECGWTEFVSEYKQKYHEPNESDLFAVCEYLNVLAAKQHSSIAFEVWYEDYGIAVPAGIVATW